MSRTELGQDLPPEYGPRLPAILLTYYGLILEAILYCDHFSDFRSSIMLRIFADHLHDGIEVVRDDASSSRAAVHFNARNEQD
ncbi:hypothetical protein DICVIV_13626 [Dictyocaulus viviparus]|uniref:Uncharacterized protein n=1 Tax=Dictyocaulus viviparus TaxID=29172 RepID=A0A0D8X7A1_DICVI|nr:hypothetical protein DICVIV_13626 [Dictyocaulus viviparus]